MQWETVIGLEVHVQLATVSKIFSGAKTAYGAPPNSQICAIDIGLPGVLPVVNETAIHMAIKFGLGINAQISERAIFARKNYFYPDLPKGYQISQLEHPIVGNGYLDVIMDDSHSKRINITRAHLEEDAGKSLHEDFAGMTGIDLNRTGTPLLEIVSEPELRSAKEAVCYLKTLHSLVRYLAISDGNMQEGSFRCDANVSVRPMGAEKLGTRTEVKNINSFRFVEKAINYEVQRQIDLIESGNQVVQETRLFDVQKNETRPMRSKEDANDYRYFPDPDLLPIMVSQDLIATIREQLPELPAQRHQRFITDYQLSTDDANTLISSKELADYFEQVVSAGAPAKLASNWVISELLGALNKADLELAASPIAATALGGLLIRVNDNTISGKIAKTVFEAMWQQSGVSADEIIAAQGLQQVTDSSAIEAIVDEVLLANPKQLAQYKSGKDKLFGYFVGQVMKATKGKANPTAVNEILKQKL